MSLTIKYRYRPINFFYASVVFFAFFAFSFMIGSLSFIPHESSAEDYPNGDDSDSAIALTVNRAELNLPDSAVFSILETVETADNIDIIVGTNNSTGFALTMSINGTTTGLTHMNGITTIPNTSNLSPADLDINTWGYNMGADATTFKRFPGLGSHIILTNTDLPAKTSTTTVTIGAKADTTLPSGYYTSTLKFTAVAN